MAYSLKLSLLIAIIFGQLAVPAALVVASGIDIRPFLIDVEMQPRDSQVKDITLKNNYPTRKAVIYATVNEISVGEGGEIEEFVTPAMTDRTDTVTSWIEISRAKLEVLPGETLAVPLTVRVNPYAKPGTYHAFIGFVEASKRYKAEAVALAGDADGVILKVTVPDQRKDSMRISHFLIDRFVTGASNRNIQVEVENMGDLPSAPAGEIIFYDSRGAEVGNVQLQSNQSIKPGETAMIDAEVPLSSTLGRFKANVSLSYGDNQMAALYDTTYFYMLPWHIILIVISAILVVSLLITLLLKRAFSAGVTSEEGDEVIMYVKDGHTPQPQDHDIDLKNNST